MLLHIIALYVVRMMLLRYINKNADFLMRQKKRVFEIQAGFRGNTSECMNQTCKFYILNKWYKNHNKIGQQKK